MSKSIYEEALENAQILSGLLNVYEPNATRKYLMLSKIEYTLEQAQKQEEQIKIVVKAIKKAELSKFQILSILSAIVGIGNEYDKMNLDDFIKGE